VHLGTKVIHEVPDLYELTYDGYWSHIDLRVIWNTTNMPNGKYTLTYKAYRLHPMIPDTLQQYYPLSNDLDHLTLILNNSGVEAQIHDVRYDPCSPNWDANTDGVITGCSIITLQSKTENLRLRITARHPDGYLRRWILDALYGKNQYAGVIASETYPGTIPPDDWEGVVDEVFETKDAASFADWVRCAYQFRLRAYTRATNGQDYLYHSPPIYYSRDFADIGLVASRWLEECVATCE
jgi:hypothetical protein